METREYDVKDFQKYYLKDAIKEIVKSLDEKGYNGINQITGYLLSGDPGYISSYNDSRKKILKIKKEDLIKDLLEEYIK